MKRGLHISSSSFPFRNFSLNQTLKQPSYLAFRSLHSGPIEFISESRSQVDKCHKDNYQIPSRQILDIHLTNLKSKIDKYQITIDKYQTPQRQIPNSSRQIPDTKQANTKYQVDKCKISFNTHPYTLDHCNSNPIEYRKTFDMTVKYYMKTATGVNYNWPRKATGLFSNSTFNSNYALKRVQRQEHMGL